MKVKAFRLKLFRYFKNGSSRQISLKVYPRDLFILAFLSIIVIGGIFRFYNLNWDKGLTQHPDEKKMIINAINIDIPYNLEPTYYTYNGFPMYLDRIVAETVSEITDNPDWVSNWGELTKITRTISATISTLTLPLIFIFIKKYFDKNVALLGMMLASFNVGLIQQAHFGTAETFLIFFIITIFIITFELVRNPLNNKLYFLLSICSGLAIATKTTGVAFLIIPLSGILISLFKNKSKKEIFFQLLIFIFITSLVSFVSSPYSLINLKDFLGSMRYEKDIVDMAIEVPWNIQFINKSPLLAITNLFWLMTFPLVIVGGLGIVLDIYKILKARKLDEHLIVWIFFIFYFLYIASWEVKFIRYYTLLIPFIILGFLLFIQNFKEQFHKLRLFVVSITIFIAFGWTIAFMNIYTSEYTRISATRWIYENVDDKSTIMTEIFDEGLPLRIYENGKLFNFVSIGMYEADSDSKTIQLTTLLNQSDYLILSSERFYKTVGVLDKKYPISSSYYNKLFKEELGFELISEFIVSPEIFSVKFDDYSAEETLRTFDHPRVYIFKNSGQFSQKELYNLINDSNI